MTAHLSPQRWETLWQALGAPVPAGSFTALAQHYSEPHRHYHNGAHINACLHHLDNFQHLARDLPAVEFALWTHDAIYDTHRQDNEALSADLAVYLLVGAGIPARAEEVGRHILATAHTEPAEADDAGLVVDIDLAVLALPAEAYLAYTHAIRAEYSWVPAALFNAGRAKVLNTLLQMPYLYSHGEIRALCEEPARANLKAELRDLMG
jgi:predicted metal-dependent HD superfamily phosphohydrolase